MELVKNTLKQSTIFWYIGEEKVRLCDIIAGFTPR